MRSTAGIMLATPGDPAAGWRSESDPEGPHKRGRSRRRHTAGMAARERPRDRGRRRAREAVGEIVGELRTQRLDLGLSQDAVASAAGLSQPALSRVERKETAEPRLGDLFAIAAVLGLDLRLNAYPSGEPVRDHVQIRLLPAMRSRVPKTWPWLTEAPLPIAGDRRAWDAVAIAPEGWTAFEAISRFGAVDATVRRVRLKQRDDPRIRRVVLVIADTHRNRRALDAARPTLAADFPLVTREVLRDLAEGRMPRADGIIVLGIPARRREAAG
jgi:transcriptional regulator with XRE-family HTH domain